MLSCVSVGVGVAVVVAIERDRDTKPELVDVSGGLGVLLSESWPLSIVVGISSVS